MGWVYNTEFVTEEQVSTWEGVFADKSLSKKITIKDAVRDSYIVGLAMVYKNDLLNATTTEEKGRAEKEIVRLSACVKSIEDMVALDEAIQDILLKNS
jgi:hypothetical protein